MAGSDHGAWILDPTALSWQPIEGSVRGGRQVAAGGFVLVGVQAPEPRPGDFPAAAVDPVSARWRYAPIPELSQDDVPVLVGGTCPTRTFETTVRNLGGVEARDVVVRYYVGDPTAGGAAIHDELVPGPIPPGGMVTFTASVAFPTRSAFVYAVVDPDDRVFERDDANNTDSTDERIECGPS